MKFTLAWLRDHLDTAADAATLAAALTDLGLEVEEVADPARRLGAFTIARVIEARAHPNADRLRVCRVATWPAGPGGPMEEVQVVCGAANARTGLVGVFAPPGTRIPGTGVDLRPGVIRGEASNGMLCSERELELSDDHAGIIELPADAPLGARWIDWAGLADPVIHIKVTPNRPDALGVRGIARDLAARGLGTLKPQAAVRVAGGFPSPVTVAIDPRLRARGCPLFAGRLIRGVRNGPSPAWLQRRLRAIGLRPISALVDVTNFFTVDRNRPLHVFDAARLAGGLRIHPAAGGEEIATLDGRTYRVGPGTMLIADDQGPVSLAGIMGGAATGVSEATTDVFVESAYWDPLTVAATGRALRVASDARYRFERGVDPEDTLPGLEAATAMILELCGGSPGGLAVDGAVPATDRSYAFDPGRLRRLVGLEMPAAAQRATLAALGFRLADGRAHPPSWRPDIQGEADLVEEVARVASLAGLKGVALPRPAPGVARPVLTAAQRRAGLMRRAAAAQGFSECVSYSFIAAAPAALFGGGGDAARIENPISSEMTHLRPDLLPGLLLAAARNQARGFADLALFEVGPVFAGGEPGEERAMLAGLRVGAAGPRDPHGSRRPVDIHDARADAEAVLAAAGAPARLRAGRATAPFWHPGRAGTLALGPRILAEWGEIHPRVLAALDVRGPAVAFTLAFDALPLPRTRAIARPALRLSGYQTVERDFAFVLDARIEAAAVVAAAQGADRGLITEVRVFDEFAGPRAEAQFGPGRKSLALTVRLEPSDRTLTEAEIEAVAARLIDRVARATGGALRS
ncbi:MAG: phenylalanine--tRNA ligase subunit beta [Rhodobacteraceae bacterium]|nr:phenylalanine--tRNA ligase subunit beta [Paracoccaceae bacterium]